MTRALSRATFNLSIAVCGVLFLVMVSAQERQPSKTKQGGASIQASNFAVIDRDLKSIPKLMIPVQDEIKEANPRKHYGREERLRNIPRAPIKMDSLVAFQQRVRAVDHSNDLRKLELGTINMEGQGFSNVNPPDTSGDVGLNHYIQAINTPTGTSYTIYKKTNGSIEAGPFQLSTLGGAGAKGMGDPIVLYDHLADRWLLSEFTDTPFNGVHVYISKTNDPVTGGWFHYIFKTSNFPDYPKFGVWSDGYYMTSNESDGPAIYAMDRKKMLVGDSTATMQRFLADQLTGFGFQALTPTDLDGKVPPTGSPFYLMRHRDDEIHNVGSSNPSQDFLDLFELRVDWTDPSKSKLTGPIGIPCAEFDSNLNGLSSMSCFPQMGSTIRLDPLREVIMHRLQYRNFDTHETIMGCFVTDVDGLDHGGIRWFELRRTAPGAWHIHQEGTYAPDSHHRWMPSIAMDGKGNVAIAFNITSDTLFPGIRIVGRTASDPMGTMPRGEVVLINGSAANNSFRYGDYATLSVDPSDDQTFWYTGQYNPATKWSTRIGTFTIK